MKVSFEKAILYHFKSLSLFIVIIQTIPHTAMERANRILTGGYFYAGIFNRKREKGGRSMQIYSAMIPVKESFSKKEFVRLVLEWNQGSPCDRMKGVNWDGESYSLCVAG